MEERDKHYRKRSRSPSEEKHRKHWKVFSRHHHHQDSNEDFHYSRSHNCVKRDDDRVSTMRTSGERHDSRSRRSRSRDKRMLGDAASGDTKLKSRFEVKSERLRVNSELLPTTSDRVPQPTIAPVATTTKLVEDIEKRKLIFSKKVQPAESSASATTHSRWEQTKFSDDNDGKIQAKFKRLMGMKSENPSEGNAEKVSSNGKRNDQYLADLEKQYEVARVATHTQRGLGLGFASRADRQPL